MSGIEQVVSDTLLCEWSPVSYFFFSADVYPLVYYSHLFPALAALVLGLIVFFVKQKGLTHKLFLIICLSFILFALLDVLLWAMNDPSLIMFYWSSIIYTELFLYAAVLYFVLAYIKGEDINIYAKSAIFILLFPMFFFGATELNLLAFDYTNCWKLAIEGYLSYYLYAVEAIFSAWIIVYAFLNIRKNQNPERKKASNFITIGSLLMLLSLSSGNIFGTLFQNVMGEEAWVIGQYGLFGMPVFLTFILYTIVRFKLFNMKVIATQAIVIGLWILVGSQFFIAETNTGRYVSVATLVLISILGFLLIRSVKKEIQQREEIEVLAERLKKANERLKILDRMKSEFVSIASHQLRSPLTSIRGYASMLAEGTYGKIPNKVEDVLRHIEDSSRFMAQSVEDYLNVSRIEAGNMKYEYSDFNLKDQAERIVDELRQVAMKKGLAMVFRSDIDKSATIHADIGKVRQVIMNLIDNSMKYTKEGSITVLAHDDVKKKTVTITIQDTGIGMNKETLEEVFDKFIRAKNANEVNVTGTGLGLFVAKKMVDQMGGRVWAESEGEGKGSTFHLEFKMIK